MFPSWFAHAFETATEVTIVATVAREQTKKGEQDGGGKKEEATPRNGRHFSPDGPGEARARNRTGAYGREADFRAARADELPALVDFLKVQASSRGEAKILQSPEDFISTLTSSFASFHREPAVRCFAPLEVVLAPLWPANGAHAAAAQQQRSSRNAAQVIIILRARAQIIIIITNNTLPLLLAPADR